MMVLQLLHRILTPNCVRSGKEIMRDCDVTEEGMKQ